MVRDEISFSLTEIKMKVVKLFAFAICAAVSASQASAKTSPEDPGQRVVSTEGKTEPAKGNAVGQSALTGGSVNTGREYRSNVPGCVGPSSFCNLYSRS
jgi:hypothetical protein